MEIIHSVEKSMALQMAVPSSVTKYPKSCGICEKNSPELRHKNNFEEHLMSKHFPFINEALKKLNFPVHCIECRTPLGNVQDAIWHLNESYRHKITKKAYEAMLEDKENNVNLSTTIKNWISSTIVELDYYFCSVANYD